MANWCQMIQICDLVGTLYIPVSKRGSVNGILVTGAIKWQEKGHLAMILIWDLEIEVLFLAKGQLISKCPYEKSVSSKMPTKIFLKKGQKSKN